MKKNQIGFAIIDVVVILVVLGAIVLVGWHFLNNKTGSSTNNAGQTEEIQSNSSNTYKISGTESYICTKSIPAQCSGLIKVQFSDKTQRSVEIDKDTDFNGVNPADLYRSDKSPLNADLELDGDLVKSIKLL